MYFSVLIQEFYGWIYNLFQRGKILDRCCKNDYIKFHFARPPARADTDRDEPFGRAFFQLIYSTIIKLKIRNVVEYPPCLIQFVNIDINTGHHASLDTRQVC